MPRRASDSLIFDTLRLEGGLFVPAVLEKAARGEHTAQKAADYRLPKGLSLVDEQGRAFRIASALHKTFLPVRARHDVDAARATLGFVTELLRDALGYADISLSNEPVVLADRAYPVTAFVCGGQVPIIVAPHTLDLDTTDERFAIQGSGRRKVSAYQLAQQFLNASNACTWAVITNGRQLRLVRDADTLTRPAFLEADLDLILTDQRYSDFGAIWRLFHASRAGAPDVPGDTYPWESWKKEGQEQGQRVREGLRTGVTDALLALGTGIIEHPANEDLRLRLQSGDLAVNDYLQQLFRLIYRFLFLFTVEERGLLHVEDETPEARRARDAYAQGYSFRRLRDRALRRAGFDRYSDIWTSVRIVFAGLADGQPRLALPALGGLFAATQCPDLDSASLENRVLLTAMRHLRWSASSGQLAAIDYRNMDSEELGSVYESLLELVPTVDLPARHFGFVGLTDAGSTAGNARKTSGSYYTPDSLVQELIKSALDPVIAQKIADHPANPIEALLSLSVCDPSCGSGHFLLSAARRLAEKLAELRAVDGAVTLADYRHALREVASRCLYGVDINPLAVELCRVALWLETIDPGKPLGFLNHHIRTGNSLLGTTPDLIAAGLPDDTFTAIEGDDKAACSELKKRNKREREGFGPLFQQEEQAIRDRLRLAATQIEAMDDSQTTARDQKEAAFATSEAAPEYRHAKLLADLWCAAFVIKKHYPGGTTEDPVSTSPAQVAPVEGQLLHSQDELFGLSAAAPAPKVTSKKQPKTKNPEQGTPTGITTAHLRDFVQGKPLLTDLQPEVEALADRYRFFHWHLAFPKVFSEGGFSCILGNPPWEKINIKEKEWFAERRPDIVAATNAGSRKRLIENLKLSAPLLHQQFLDASRQAEGESHFLRDTGRYPLCARGDINLFAIFAEANRQLLSSQGRVGCVLPTGIATDDTTKFFIQDALDTKALVSLFDFENKGIFPGVHSSYKFCLFTCGSGRVPIAESSEFVFFAHSILDLSSTEKRFNLSGDDIGRLNPNSRTCPVLRSRSDAEILKHIYRRHRVILLHGPPLQNPWNIEFGRLFHITDDFELFLTKTKVDALREESSPLNVSFSRLYEGRYGHQFDHRFATFEHGDSIEISPTQHADPNLLIEPEYWVTNQVSEEFLLRRPHRCRTALLGYRRVASSTNERTSLACILPWGAASYGWIMSFGISTEDMVSLCATYNSFVFDYILRNSLSQPSIPQGTFEQVAVPHPSTYAQPCPWASNPQSDIPNPQSLRDWLLSRVLELTYTAWDLEPFAADCGWDGPPFRWDEERRFLLRCELDAAFFHLYLGPEIEWQQQPEALTRAFPAPRHAVAYIMDTFPIVKRKDEAKHGGIYRTKETILQIYDALQESIRTGQLYQTRLDPPPADSRCCHPSRLSIPAPDWMDRPLVYPTLPRGRISPALYRASVVPHLVYQAGGELSFDRFRRAYWLLTEPKTLLRYAKGEIGREATKWSHDFHDHLEKEHFIPHLRSAVRNDLRFITVDGQRRLQLRHTDNLSVDDHAIFDARLALWVAELWPSGEPISPLTQAEEVIIKELELVM